MGVAVAAGLVVAQCQSDLKGAAQYCVCMYRQHGEIEMQGCDHWL